jgi:hypothetical protein
VASTITKPVELGDYLDEEPPKPPKAREQPRIAEPVAVEIEAPPAREPTQRALIPGTERLPRAEPANPTRMARQRSTIRRKQVNMNPETLGMVDDLLSHFQRYSVQKDLAASELFEALVLSLFEAREQLDLSRIGPRGRWGTPTATSFPGALANAIQEAIRRYTELKGRP